MTIPLIIAAVVAFLIIVCVVGIWLGEAADDWRDG